MKLVKFQLSPRALKFRDNKRFQPQAKYFTKIFQILIKTIYMLLCAADRDNGFRFFKSKSNLTISF